ncbi:family A1 protease [Sistotremastrum suecicum HHB10207 ss-3]|uniref:Family A1 protease n=1 Tax=Sistotremastrum suecicum HHB10207 ss-3 TaxID=1314776 RepID=A0A165YHV1_9AGAM|nr:family A1 protease [Sistotremastrum suecicum HHB10207 ss-3]
MASPILDITEPSFNIPISRLPLDTPLSGFTLLQHDQERAKYLLSRGNDPLEKRTASINVTNVGTTYVASVGVGTPATTYSLLIDTGSSNTWVGASKKYVQTSSSKSTGNSVKVTYGSGSFSGTEYTDTVTLSQPLAIRGQSIGVAANSMGFSAPLDGILGIGPVGLTRGTVGNTPTVPTVTDNLKSQGTISTEVIGISYEPTASGAVTNGELTFGGVDSMKYTGSISYNPITSTSPAGLYWGINQNIQYGSTTVLSSTAGIVDTGTTLVLLATDAFQRYKTATGATRDSNTGLLTITNAQYNALKNLDFSANGVTYSLTPNAQIWPRTLNTAIGGTASGIYLVVSDLGSHSGNGLDFIMGYTFLERFYSVYDTTNKRVGFATTKYTTSTNN